MAIEAVPAAATIANEGLAVDLATASPLLTLANIEVKYQGSILVLKGLSLEVRDAEIVALLGANGAGKTTTLRAISGLLRAQDGAVTGGTIDFAGTSLVGLEPSQVVRLGIVQVLEGRRVLEHMTVEQNLIVAGRGAGQRALLHQVYGYLPKLATMRTHRAGYLSGGEQQMLVLGRAIMARPHLLMLDEPSLGLAPIMVETVYALIKRLHEELGLSILLVEQNASVALSIADRGYLLENGRIMLDASAAQLRDNEDLKEFYLGLGGHGERKSFREVKHYRRRKRWLG